jgi:cytochrome c-type biogenesis protein CcmH
MRALLFTLLASVAVAQEPQDPSSATQDPSSAEPTVEAASIPGVPPGPAPAPADLDRLARDVGSRLRCPVCQGLSVADSNSAAATQMQGLVRDLVAAGYTRAQIEDYFVGKYGEWVLLDPRAGGLNLLVWVGPLAGLALAGAVAASLARRLPDDEREARDPDTVVDETAGGALPPDDPHAARLLAEVDDD